MSTIRLFVENGQKKTFVGALDWPGWCRSGRAEQMALQELLAYGPRYAQLLDNQGIPFQPPLDLSYCTIIERTEGTATTDFGAPDSILTADYDPLGREEFERLQAALQACWQAFDNAAAQALGKTLRQGPRGGGRELEQITDHILDADRAYLGSIAWKHKIDPNSTQAEQLQHMRQAILAALEAGFKGELPDKRPRGGAVWPLRYYIRRSAWHVADHAWELEDRLE